MKWFWVRLRACMMATGIVTLAACGGGDSGVRLTNGFSTQSGAQQMADAFAATLSAEQQLPPSTSNAQGAGSVVIDPDSREMVAVVTTSGVTPTAVTIREATPGVTGPIVLPLTESPAGSGVWATTAALSEEQLADLRAGRFYFEVTSLAFPQGELRGQITPQLPAAFVQVPADGTTSGASPLGSGAAGGVPTPGFGTGPATPATFVAALRGTQVVPPTTSVAQGSGTVTMNPATRQVAAAVATSGLAPTSAVIGLGAPGVNGPVILALSETGSGSGVWLARAVLSADEFNALAAGNTHFVVRSAAFPEGEIRGQLLPQQQTAGLAPTPAPASSQADPGLPTFGGGRNGLFIDGSFGAGTPGIGTSGFGTTGIGTPGIGTPGIGTVDMGGTSGFGLPGTGTSTIGTPGLGTTSPLNVTGMGGIGTSGFGTSNPASLGIGSSGIGTGFATPGSIGLSGSTPGSIGLSGTAPGSIGLGGTTLSDSGLNLASPASPLDNSSGF